MMKLITEELLDTVTSRAKENSRLRMNYNFHASMYKPQKKNPTLAKIKYLKSVTNSLPF